MKKLLLISCCFCAVSAMANNSHDGYTHAPSDHEHSASHDGYVAAPPEHTHPASHDGYTHMILPEHHAPMKGHAPHALHK